MTASPSVMDFVVSIVTALLRALAPARRDIIHHRKNGSTVCRFASTVSRTASARRQESANAMSATRKYPKMAHASQCAIQVVGLISFARSPISAIV